MFGLSYPLPKTAVYEYVIGKILVPLRQICFFLDCEHLVTHDFDIR